MDTFGINNPDCIFKLKPILHNYTWTDNVTLGHIAIPVDFYSHDVDFYSMSTIDEDTVVGVAGIDVYGDVNHISIQFNTSNYFCS